MWGDLLYLKNNINYTLRDDLKIYKSKEVESTFIEIINPKEKNIIVGCIYRHHCMDTTEFNSFYLKNLSQKLSREKKSLILMGDFNIDILKYKSHSESTDFVDLMYTTFLLPYIVAPTRVTPPSSTLIDNIFSNNIDNGSISGNLITTISDHFAQFLLLRDLENSEQKTKTDQYKQDFLN